MFHDPVGIGVYERDRTRIVIDVTNRGYTGYEAQAILEENNIYLEMADARRLVLITSPNDEPVWYEHLLETLAALPKKKTKNMRNNGEEIRFAANEQRMSIREATFAQTQTLPLKQSEGRIAAEPVGIYPPGIALVMPGEVGDRRAIEYLLAQERGGGALFGVYEGSIFVVEDGKKTK